MFSVYFLEESSLLFIKPIANIPQSFACKHYFRLLYIFLPYKSLKFFVQSNFSIFYFIVSMFCIRVAKVSSLKTTTVPGFQGLSWSRVSRNPSVPDQPEMLSPYLVFNIKKIMYIFSSTYLLIYLYLNP